METLAEWIETTHQLEELAVRLRAAVVTIHDKTGDPMRPRIGMLGNVGLHMTAMIRTLSRSVEEIEQLAETLVRLDEDR